MPPAAVAAAYRNARALLVSRPPASPPSPAQEEKDRDLLAFAIPRKTPGVTWAALCSQWNALPGVARIKNGDTMRVMVHQAKKRMKARDAVEGGGA